MFWKKIAHNRKRPCNTSHYECFFSGIFFQAFIVLGPKKAHPCLYYQTALDNVYYC